MNTRYVVNLIDLGLVTWSPSSLIELHGLNHNYMSLQIQQLQLEKRFHFPKFPKSRNIRSLLSRGHLHACSWLVFGGCSILVGLVANLPTKLPGLFPKILSQNPQSDFKASKLWNQSYRVTSCYLLFVWLQFFFWPEKTHTNYPWNITTCWKILKSLCRPDLQLYRHRLSECIVN